MKIDHIFKYYIHPELLSITTQKKERGKHIMYAYARERDLFQRESVRGDLEREITARTSPVLRFSSKLYKIII